MPLGDVWGNSWGASWNSFWAIAEDAPEPEVTAPVTTAGRAGATSYARKTLKQLAREKRKQLAAEARARVMRAVEAGAVNDNKGLTELLADVRQDVAEEAPKGMSRQEMDDLFRRIGEAAKRALQEQEDDDEVAFLLAV